MTGSWRTTVGGLAAGVGPALALLAAAQDPVPFWLLIVATVFTSGGIALMGLVARDDVVSSKQVDAQRVVDEQPPIDRSVTPKPKP